MKEYGTVMWLLNAIVLSNCQIQNVNQRSPVFTSTGLVPTSITTAPGFSQFPRTRFGTPAAVTTMSASQVISSGFFVKACTMLTVAWCLCTTIWRKLCLYISMYGWILLLCHFWKRILYYLQQQWCGQSNNVTSPNHSSFPPRYFHTRPEQHLNATLGSAGNEQRLPSSHGKISHIKWMEAIHIFLWSQHIQNFSLIQMLSQTVCCKSSIQQQQVLTCNESKPQLFSCHTGDLREISIH